MSLANQLRKEKLEAFKSKDNIKNGVLSLLISALALKEKEEKRTLTETEEFQIVQKELKQTRESLESTPSNRTDLIEETTSKIKLLESYLPQQLSQEELAVEINLFMEENQLEPTMKNRGAITKGMLEKFAGRTDGKALSSILSNLLK